MDDLKLLRDLGAELEHEPPPTLARQRHRLFTGRRRRRPGWWAAGLVAVATAVAVAVPVVLVGNRHDPERTIVADPVDVSGTRNVLVIGSDRREGEGNARYGPGQARSGVGARSDTIVIVHLPADRKSATAVSVPRDSIVRIPRCGSSPPRVDMINSAYVTGVACLRTTLEKLTGLRLDHTVEVDFAGFKDLVDAVGGVTVTLPWPVDDRASKLTLPAGKRHLDGEQALGYVRLRHYGDGSDIARIKRQQTVVLAMVRKAKSMLGEPDRLEALLKEVRESVETDLSVESMYQLATELSDAELNVISVPWTPHPEDKNRIAWKQPDADKLFATLR